MPRKPKKQRSTVEKIAHSISHDVRLEAYTILAQREASPKELRRMLRRTLGTVSYHVKEMEKDNLLELVRTEPRRGAVEHFYRAKVRPEISDKEWRKLPKGSRRGVVATAVNIVVAEIVAAVQQDKMLTDEPDQWALLCLPVLLNDRGRTEVRKAIVECQERIEAIAEQDENCTGADASSHYIALCNFDRAAEAIRNPALLPKKGTQGKAKKPQRRKRS